MTAGHPLLLRIHVEKMCSHLLYKYNGSCHYMNMIVDVKYDFLQLQYGPDTVNIWNLMNQICVMKG